LTLVCGMTSIWHCWGGKNINFLSQRVKLKMRSLKAISRLSASLTLCTLSLFGMYSLALEVSLLSLSSSLHSLALSSSLRSLFVHLNDSSAKGWFFISFMLEKHVKVGLLSYFWWKMMFLFVCVWFPCKVCVFICFLIEKEVFLMFCSL